MGIFKFRKTTLLDELQKNNQKSKLLNLKKETVFAKSSIFFKNLFGKININQEIYEQIEELLISLDFGTSISSYIAKRVSSSYSGKGNISNILFKELLDFYGDEDTSLNIQKGRSNVLLMVGPNGSGKTTSIAKLAFWFKSRGYRVLLVAGDTFRAGAVEQLKTWAFKLNIDIFSPSREKEHPSSLIYRSLKENQHKQYDLIICDTSGRNHNNQNLLQELRKVHDVINKFDSKAPHETLLVIDSAIGQITLLQAEKFVEYAKVTGILLTKMDYMSRGGIIFAIKEKFKVPVKLIGIGEQLEDLQEFNLRDLIDLWTKDLSN